MAEPSSSQYPDMPKIDDPKYAEIVCCPKVMIDFSKTREKDDIVEEIKKEIITCRYLMCAWADSKQVCEDCEKLIKSANDEIHKEQDKVDVHLAYEALLQIRQRLVQASSSWRSQSWVCGFLGIQLALLAGCTFLVVYFRLLPGQVPRLDSTNDNVIILFSAAVFGAIGGLFDGLFFLSKRYFNRQFDKGDWVWYITNSFLGAILGVVVFGVILAGLLTTTQQSFSVKNSSATTSTPAAVATSVSSNIMATPTDDIILLTLPDNVTISPPLTQTLTQTTSDNNASSDSDEKTTAGAALVLVLAFIAGIKQFTVLNRLEKIAESVFGINEKDEDKTKSS